MFGLEFTPSTVVVALIVLVLDLMKREVPMWLDCVGLVMGLCVAIHMLLFYYYLMLKFKGFHIEAVEHSYRALELCGGAKRSGLLNGMQQTARSLTEKALAVLIEQHHADIWLHGGSFPTTFSFRCILIFTTAL